MNKNYEFFLQTDVNRYIGEWIAISDRKIIATGKSVKEVLAKAKKVAPKKRPFITKVPEKSAMIF